MLVRSELKIRAGHDVEPLTLVRDRYPDVSLAADANGSYPSADAVPRALAGLDLAYLEQPLAEGDLDGAARLVTALGTPIALDESLTSVRRLEEAAAFGVPFTVSVKVGRLGGVTEAVLVLAEVARLGFDAFVGGMLETAVRARCALALAAQSACTLPCDAGPTARYFAADIGPAFVPDADGALLPPSGPRDRRHPGSCCARTLLRGSRDGGRMSEWPVEHTAGPADELHGRDALRNRAGA